MQTSETRKSDRRAPAGGVQVAMLLSMMWAAGTSAQDVVAADSSSAGQAESARTVEKNDFRARVGELSGRHRIELRLGVADQGGSTVRTDVGGMSSHVRADNFSAGLGYSYWLRPDWAVTATVSYLNANVDARLSGGTGTGAETVGSLLVGLRRDFRMAGQSRRLRPYVTAAVGPYFRSAAMSRWAREMTHTSVSEFEAEAAFGGLVGGGVDVQLGRLVMLGAQAGYNFMTDFPTPMGGRDNYGGFQGGLSISFLFGKGMEPQE